MRVTERNLLSKLTLANRKSTDMKRLKLRQAVLGAVRMPRFGSRKCVQVSLLSTKIKRLANERNLRKKRFFFYKFTMIKAQILLGPIEKNCELFMVGIRHWKRWSKDGSVPFVLAISISKLPPIDRPNYKKLTKYREVNRYVSSDYITKKLRYPILNNFKKRWLQEKARCLAATRIGAKSALHFHKHNEFEPFLKLFMMRSG